MKANILGSILSIRKILTKNLCIEFKYGLKIGSPLAIVLLTLVLTVFKTSACFKLFILLVNLFCILFVNFFILFINCNRNHKGKVYVYTLRLELRLLISKTSILTS